MLRVFNYNTLEKVEMFEAHSDYIRSIIVHPTQPYILTSSGKLEILCLNFQLLRDYSVSLLLYILFAIYSNLYYLAYT